MTTAHKVAKEKKLHPERYCPIRGCLWKTGGGYCPRHTKSVTITETMSLEEFTKRWPR